MSTTSPQLPTSRGARYDLLAANLAIAVIAALLLAAVGSNVTVVQLLEKTEIAGIEVNLAVGAAVNPGVIVAAVSIFFRPVCGDFLHLAQPPTGPNDGGPSGGIL